MKYENCMKGLEYNDYFICQQHVTKNQKFAKCMQELRNKRLKKIKIKRKLVEDDADDNFDDANKEVVDSRTKIYNTVSH